MPLRTPTVPECPQVPTETSRHRQSPSSRTPSLGALAAGFGLVSLMPLVQAQTAPQAAPAQPPAVTAGKPDTTLKGITVKAQAETDATSLRATTSGIGKGNQDLRDIPQSVTVVTEKLMDDRRVDTLKDALHQTAGISFQAAEGGEEDIRLRGFSLAASGDIYIDGLRDPAFYERDVFNFDRVELLRGSASMLFGRGSTGGVVNQVNKQPFLANAGTLEATVGSGKFYRFTGDYNLKLDDRAAGRIGVMKTVADNHGNALNKYGIAPSLRLGIGTDDEVTLSGFYLRNDNGINYGIPWLRQSGALPTSDTNPAGLTPISPRNNYAAASDRSAGGAAYGTLTHVHRFGAGFGELKTALRHGYYDRDQRAGAIRWCTRSVGAGGVINNPDCPGVQPGVDTVNGDSPLTRGTNNKVQDLHTTYLQTDYSNRINGFGLTHELLTGIDLARERFNGYGLIVPAGVMLDKNSPRVTLGNPSDGTFVDETRRDKRLASDFEAKSAGIYLQDLLQITDTIKLLAGLRYDRFEGDYGAYATSVTAATPVIGVQTALRSRSDGVWSRRFGALYQPDDALSFHASYGTSFNTSGDTYQYDTLGSNTPPEGSENIELGAKLDLLAGKLSVGAAIFRSTKTNERNRDSDQGADQYLLSGKRHASGLELDVAGRLAPGWDIYASYAWIPSARVDRAGSGGTLTGEREGDRPSLTPRHSGTVWTTYQVTDALRLGAGINARSSQTPNRNPVGIVAPSWVTGDLMAEYAFNDGISLKLNVLNVSNRLYADALYTGHYVPGAARTVEATLSTRF